MTRTRKRVLLISLAGSGLAVLLSGVAFMRPTARANRLCRDAGFGSLPASAHRVRMRHRGRVVGTPSVYLRFETTPADARLLFERSGIDPNNEPVPMRRLHFGPKSPPWMQWGDAVNGWIWHINRGNASVWLAIDEDSGTVYIGVHHLRPSWVRRLLGR